MDDSDRVFSILCFALGFLGYPPVCDCCTCTQYRSEIRSFPLMMILSIKVDRIARLKQGWGGVMRGVVIYILVHRKYNFRTKRQQQVEKRKESTADGERKKQKGKKKNKTGSKLYKTNACVHRQNAGKRKKSPIQKEKKKIYTMKQTKANLIDRATIVSSCQNRGQPSRSNLSFAPLNHSRSPRGSSTQVRAARAPTWTTRQTTV